jgi:uncharacterized delta-60 repeat protein
MTIFESARWFVLPLLAVSAVACGGEPPVTHGKPHREWLFQEYRANGLEPVTVGQGDRDGGVLDESHDFGSILTSGGDVNLDGRAIGRVYATPSGETYHVITEAPTADTDLNKPDSPIGNIVYLAQHQSFKKNAADATMRFVVSRADVRTVDDNPEGLSYQECPTRKGCEGTIEGEIHLQVSALKNDSPFMDRAGGAIVNGYFQKWDFDAWTESWAENGLWDKGSFDFNPDFYGGGAKDAARLQLNAAKSFDVPLAAVNVGEEFTLQVLVSARTYDRRGHESTVWSSLFDPLHGGGTAVETTGLEPTDNPITTTPPHRTDPVPCVSGPNPAAGILQFSKPAYDAPEWPARPVVFVTRSGGNAGAVSVTLTTAGGTATPNVDYEPLTTTVYFGDGDTTPRAVRLPIRPDATPEEDETVNVTLSAPGGCAMLGADASAILTILDDDRPEPIVPSGLDPSFGDGGKLTTGGIGGSNSAMALQKDGKIVMVGGGFTSFVAARYNADGSLDTGFGGRGSVTLDVSGGQLQQRALGVALQPDDKLVVVGETLRAAGTRGQFTFGLVRFNPDGSLDQSFGSGGQVVDAPVVGNATAVAIQPDGKIVVAGSTPGSGDEGDFSDFIVARYTSAGALDPSFGTGGVVITDGGGSNEAHNVVLQPDGKIVVSGGVFNASRGINQTDLARYMSSGVLDPSFGIAGKLQLAGKQLGDGLALQPDGKLVLVGNVETATAPQTATQFAVMRMNADGTPDNAFGTAGFVQTAFTAGGDRALAVTLAADGKILVAGSSNQGNTQFALARYNTDGSLDAGFVDGGKATVEIGPFADAAEGVAIQPDGKIVLGGFSKGTSSTGYALARIAP